MNITKIKFEEGKTIVHFEQEQSGGSIQKETIYRCDEERHPDFQQAVDDLIPLALNLLKLPVDYKGGVTFRGLSLSENEHQGLGAVVTMLKEIPGINSPFTMNTPHVHNAEDGNSIMPTALRNQIEKCLKEAKAFLEEGKRKQADMFAEAA